MNKKGMIISTSQGEAKIINPQTGRVQLLSGGSPFNIDLVGKVPFTGFLNGINYKGGFPC